jgi:hypothetical protein
MVPMPMAAPAPDKIVFPAKSPSMEVAKKPPIKKSDMYVDTNSNLKDFKNEAGAEPEYEVNGFKARIDHKKRVSSSLSVASSVDADFLPLHNASYNLHYNLDTPPPPIYRHQPTVREYVGTPLNWDDKGTARFRSDSPNMVYPAVPERVRGGNNSNRQQQQSQYQSNQQPQQQYHQHIDPRLLQQQPQEQQDPYFQQNSYGGQNFQQPQQPVNSQGLPGLQPKQSDYQNRRQQQIQQRQTLQNLKNQKKNKK